MEPLEYCAEKVAVQGTPGYYAVLFQPPVVRNALLALRALQRELAEVVEQCTEREIAQRKLLYWQQELAQRETLGAGAHPVTRAIATYAPDALDHAAVQKLLDATARRIAHAQVRDESEFDELNCANVAPIASACARLAGDQHRAVLEVATAIERLRLLSLPQRAGLPPHSGIALRTLTQCAVTPTDVDRGGNDPALVRLRRDLLDKVFAALDQADKLPGERRGYTATCLRLAQCLAHANRRGGYAESGQLIHVAPLRLLWHAWRARQHTN